MGGFGGTNPNAPPTDPSSAPNPRPAERMRWVGVGGAVWCGEKRRVGTEGGGGGLWLANHAAAATAKGSNSGCWELHGAE